MKKFKELLEELNACSDARIWAEDMTIEEVVEKCQRGDWLLWLAKKIDIDLRPLTLAKARCAKTVIHLMKDKRSINAVYVAERFGAGNATIDELNAAAYSADAAYADAAAAYSADAAYADAAAYSADAAYAAHAAADVAYAAHAAAAANAYDERLKNQNETAEICRDILGELIINKVNELLNNKNNGK